MLLLALAVLPPHWAAAESVAAVESFGFLKGSVWHWNRWRHVVFGDDGVFNAPDAACGNASCTWSVDVEGSVHVDWGEQGRHTLKPTAMRAADGTELHGSRLRDGDAVVATWVKPLRGVPPGQLERFYDLESGETSFLLPPTHCNDVTADMVNDDYCDCGYDEPQTAACSVSDIRGPVETTAAALESSRTFWCVNAGWRGAPLFVSRIGDGICDCCDGSDEPAGNCEPTCAREATQENIKIRQKLQEVTSALKAKDEGAQQGKQEHAKWVADLPRLKSELAALLPSFDDLEAAHAALLQNEAAQNEAEAAFAATSGASAEVEPDSVTNVVVPPQECDWDGQLVKEPGAAVFADYQDLGVWMEAVVLSLDGDAKEQQFSVVYTEDSEVENGIEPARVRPRAPRCKGLEIYGSEEVVGVNATCGEVSRPTCRPGYAGGSQQYVCRGDGQWHPIDDAAPLRCDLLPPRAPAVQSVVVDDQSLQVSFDWAIENNATYDVAVTSENDEIVLVTTREGAEHAPFAVSQAKGIARVNVSTLTNGARYAISVTAVNAAGRSEATASQRFSPSPLKAEFAAATRARSSTTKTIASLEKKLALVTAGALGTEFEYASLLNKCASGKGKSGSHTFKVCGFATVDQKDDNGKWVRVGRWDGWQHPPDQSHRGTMSYVGGARCGADKKPRSASVELVCAPELTIVDANEPSTCAYAIVLGSPAACVSTDLPILWPETSLGHDEL